DAQGLADLPRRRPAQRRAVAGDGAGRTVLRQAPGKRLRPHGFLGADEAADGQVSAAMKAVVTPRPAATVTLVRDGAEGLEVLMMRRTLQSGFVPGNYVFPGGSVDRADADAAVYACCDGLDDAAASGRLGIAEHGLAYWVAAIRESFEEAGLLLARDAAGRA